MSSRLNVFDKWAFRYFVFLSPVIIGFMVWAVITEFKDQDATGLGWDIFGWIFIGWVIDMIYIVTKMLFSVQMRNAVMSKLAGLKERDERESVVAGNAAKFSFLSTLAMLIFMLVFSITTLEVRKDAPTYTKGKGSIGFGGTAIDDKAWTHEKTAEAEIIAYKGLPLTKPMLILILIFWQIGSYHLVARKELKE